MSPEQLIISLAPKQAIVMLFDVLHHYPSSVQPFLTNPRGFVRKDLLLYWILAQFILPSKVLKTHLGLLSKAKRIKFRLHALHSILSTDQCCHGFLLDEDYANARGHPQRAQAQSQQQQQQSISEEDVLKSQPPRKVAGIQLCKECSELASKLVSETTELLEAGEWASEPNKSNLFPVLARLILRSIAPLFQQTTTVLNN